MCFQAESKNQEANSQVTRLILSSALQRFCTPTLASNLLLSSVIIPGLTGCKRSPVHMITCRDKYRMPPQAPSPANRWLFRKTYQAWHVIRRHAHLSGPQGYQDQEHHGAAGPADMFMPPDEMPRSVNITYPPWAVTCKQSRQITQVNFKACVAVKEVGGRGHYIKKKALQLIDDYRTGAAEAANLLVSCSRATIAP